MNLYHYFHLRLWSTDAIRLNALAEERKITTSALMREMVNEWLVRNGKGKLNPISYYPRKSE
jgi:hypothetical protein